MWQLQSEPIAKQYRAGFFSRAFLLSAAFCIFAFVVPILILLSIGYSWNTYAISFVQPQLTYQNHQVTCLLSNGSALYDSTFTGELSGNSYQSAIGVGGEAGNYMISGNFFMSSGSVSIKACSLLVYFAVTLENLQSLAVLPLHFYNPSNSAANFVSLTQNGIIYTKATSAIPQSSVQQTDFTSYYSNNSQVLNMIDVHSGYAASKNVTLIPNIVSSQPTYSSTSSLSFTYTGTFLVAGEEMVVEVSLLQNLRTFIPYFIYLFILLWAFVGQPTVRWMLENKIYRAKSNAPKIKYH